MSWTYKLPLFLIVFIFNTSYVYSAGLEPYAYTENFEKNNPMKFWTASKNLPKPVITYTLDQNISSVGRQSLFVDAKIEGLKNQKKKWYYYLKIPLKKKPNLEGVLSFSMDMKINKEDAKHVAVGLNLKYYPTSSGLYSFSKLSTFDEWTQIKQENLALATVNHANNWISKNLYAGKLDNVGRGIDCIVILIRGRGAKHLQFHIDNIEIKGTQSNAKAFRKNTKKSWDKYLSFIKNELKEIKKSREALSSLGDISKKNLTPIEMKRYLRNKKYLSKIDALLVDIQEKNENKLYLKPHEVEVLKQTIEFYKNNISSLKAKENLTLYAFPALKYYRLNGNNTPKLEKAKKYKLRMTAGEYQSVAMLMKANHNYDTYSVENTDFISENQKTISKNYLDWYIAKIWYQAGHKNTHRENKVLTQELLLKDETLVKVDFKSKTNYLKVMDNKLGREKYINISNPNKKFPKKNRITFNDSHILKPFTFDSTRHKLLWGIVHIPKYTSAGLYTTTIHIKNSLGIIEKSVPIEIEVLPFHLDPSKLTYALYYHGTVNEKVAGISTYQKTSKQLKLELTDMKNHGVLYPTSYDENVNKLDTLLSIKERIGFPKDRFYSLGILTYKSKLRQKIKAFKKKLKEYNYDDASLYVYALDEATEEELLEEKEDLQMAHRADAKVFVAGHAYTHKYVGDLLDTFIYTGGALNTDAKKQVKDWHDAQAEIFAYASPQVGVENPEVYRRNFGCKLWKEGFDGAMNYAYQKQYGDFWNDFDSDKRHSNYREEAFTYPTTNGIVGTIQWEGYREAITDVRYLSTLKNLINSVHIKDEEVLEVNRWLDSIDCTSDLYQLRERVIDKILYLLAREKRESINS